MFEGAVLFLVAMGILFWFFALASALSRTDFDPVTKFMWVFVIVMTTILGALLYLLIAPKVQLASTDGGSEASEGKDDTSEAAECVACGATIPAGASACPKCGWSYADAKPSS